MDSESVSVSTEIPIAHSDIDATTQKIGRDLWRQWEQRRPSVFERRWWEEHLLEWAMADESVKVQMFRFVDVLPMLHSHRSVTSHLQEYFDEVRAHLPRAMRLGIDLSQPNTILGRAVAVNARRTATRMAKRFIAGENVEEVLRTVAKLRKDGFAFSLDLLGEAVISDAEADAYQQSYLTLIEGLAPFVNQWPENSQLDSDFFGPTPRTNVSIKLSALCSHFQPADPVGTTREVLQRLRPILRTARQHEAYVHVDMEHYAYKDLTLAIFQQVLMEEEFRDWADTGIVIQAYLKDSEEDLKALHNWVVERGTPITVRLVKGAYWDYETVVAAARRWPVPVYQRKWQSDAGFESQTRFLMEHYRLLRPAIASHNLRSLSHAIATAQHLGVPQDAWEVQMLYGMAETQAHLFAEQGYRVRIYTPFGELIPGMAYLVRRLLENTSNDSFLRHSYDRSIEIEDLLMSPVKIAEREPPEEPEVETRFQNEPHTDFSIEENREAMRAALDDVRDQFGREYSIIIDGKAFDSRAKILSRNPSNKDEIIGSVAAATTDLVTEAIDACRRAFPKWSRLDADVRAEHLELMAAEIRNRRFELAAWIVFESGKPWADADADVAEAVDFCMYYAMQMRELADPREVNVPGENNSYGYRARGVAIVIAPWNFPLAILTGMTTAALVAGNTVVLKPAEQSSVIAAKLMEIIRDAQIPDGVVNFVPGIGEEIGPELVGSPDIDLIAFTGSRPVGLEINRIAGETDPRQRSVKHVIAEMGGKNAIIIDNDADLDEAVSGVVHSAFVYAGQKCSACSRVIVLEEVYDAFLQRLKHAAESVVIGPAEDPGTLVGPVIDEEAYNRIRGTIEETLGTHEPLVAVDTSKLAKKGYFIGPHIFTDIDPEEPIAQQEIFGPFLVVMSAANLDDAFEIANGTDYALTGGIYSRCPKNLARARARFEVGNLYLNRPITGALVNRQPFGGFRMSGIGTKAGGPDYLLQFLIPVNVTENTMRRGFAPSEEEEAE